MIARFLFTRFLRMITILVGVTLITFLLMHAIPGNPWSNYSSSPRMMLGLGIDATLQRELYHRFGLDLPFSSSAAENRFEIICIQDWCIYDCDSIFRNFILFCMKRTAVNE